MESNAYRIYPSDNLFSKDILFSAVCVTLKISKKLFSAFYSLNDSDMKTEIFLDNDVVYPFKK